jgi:3-oxoacyl-[acyl-carrier protein] reductase
VLVNNAGGTFGHAAAGDLADLAAAREADVRGNVLPAVLLTEALLPRLRRPGGRIVTITSIAALRGPGSYGGAKAALHAWALGLAQEGITVNAVAPGCVPDTESWAGRLTEDLVASRPARVPMTRAGAPAEIAAAVAHLAAPDAGWTNRADPAGRRRHAGGKRLAGHPGRLGCRRSVTGPSRPQRTWPA